MLPPDQSLGPFGITNCMLKASGQTFREMLLAFFNTV
jgi:hypothetical protein